MGTQYKVVHSYYEDINSRRDIKCLNNMNVKQLIERLFQLSIIICVVVIMIQFYNYKFLFVYLHNNKYKRMKLYEKQFQFTNFTLPPILLLTIYMGKFKYTHTPLLLTSMKYNPLVDFVLINIVENINISNEIIQLKNNLSVPNFHVIPLTIKDFKTRVHDRLNISVNFTSDWYYKLCDYKPTLAYLFPELILDKYKYWGYGDNDVIWGNFSRFAYLFQGSYPIVIVDPFRVNGVGTFLINSNNDLKSLFLTDPIYVQLLKNFTYHNLDEIGLSVDPINVFDNGKHSFAILTEKYAKSQNFQINRGLTFNDRLFYDEGDSVEWAGSVIWHKGTLNIIHETKEFPAYREILLYHRANSLNYPDELKSHIIEDMITYGYYLPHYIPVFSRYMCYMHIRPEDDSTITAIQSFKPYNKDCLNFGIT